MRKKKISGTILIPQGFLDSLSQFKRKHPEDWEEKYRIATKRLLSSIFYFVSARRCYKEGNKLLSAIGYYYSIFHISKALLFLLPKYSVDDLKGIPHKEVFNLVKTNFVQRRMLSDDYGEALYYLRQVREAVNYGMESWISLDQTLKNEEPSLYSCIGEAISVFKRICSNEIGRISAIIGDGIGDDWMDSYLSEDEAQEVVKILLDHDLTT